MQRREFLRFIFAGASAAAAVAVSSAPSRALTTLPALEPPASDRQAAPEAAVATESDIEQAKIEKSYWVYRRRYWRPRRRYYWRRRYYPVYRRRYYYRPRYYRRRFYYY